MLRPLIRPSATFSPACAGEKGARFCSSSGPRPTQWGEGARRAGEGQRSLVQVDSVIRYRLEGPMRRTILAALVLALPLFAQAPKVQTRPTPDHPTPQGPKARCCTPV